MKCMEFGKIHENFITKIYSQGKMAQIRQQKFGAIQY